MADLAVEGLDVDGFLALRWPGLKSGRSILDQLPSPGVDQGGMDPELLGQLCKRLVSLKGSQGDLGLELRLVTMTTTFHLSTPDEESRA